jgi:hypothetical protein
MMRALADTSFAVRPEGTTVTLLNRGRVVRPSATEHRNDGGGDGRALSSLPAG